MEPLAQALLALAMSQATPGQSAYSLEVLPECGTDPAKPTCELVPVCDEPVMACRKPKYSRARKAWVRIESRERGVQRYWAIAQSIARTARRLDACKADECEPIQWKGSTRQLALSTLTVALHESGLREDVQFGRPPFGRGPAREVCLVQVATDQAPLYASWVPEDERQRIARSRNEREKFARTLLGDEPAALDRCFEVGMRMLARARNACSKHQEWDFAMFSMYGSGRTCRLPGVADKRKETLRTLQTTSTKLRPATLRLIGRDEDPDA